MIISEKLTIIAENEQRVYDSGYEKGKSKSEGGSGKLPQIIDRTVTELTAEDLAGVTGIGKYAFSFCDSLKSVMIPDSVISIGSYAFYRCTGLTNVTIPDSVTSIGEYAFYNCSSLTSVTIPDSVISIEKNAFAFCTGLEDITIGSGVTTIRDFAFQNCTNAKRVYYNGDIESWCKIFFRYEQSNPTFLSKNLYVKNSSGGYDLITELVIPDTVTKINSYAFCGCGISTVRIGNGITSIPSNVFNGCEALTDIYIDAKEGSISGAPWGAPKSPTIHWNTPLPSLEYTLNDDGQSYSVSGVGTWTSLVSYDIIIPSTYKGLPVTAIDKRAFYLYVIESVTIGDSVESIGDSAFEWCPLLKSITIGSGLTEIGYNAFFGCTEVTSIKVNENNTVYKDIDGNLYTKDGKTLIQYAAGKTAESFTIPDGVTSIGKYAFYYCDSLKSVMIPDSVTSIDDNTFGYCDSLTDIYIDKPKDPILGERWGAPKTATIHWNT